ncbi:MAG TPA: alpha-2-macroglobulin [Rhizomicrobium sp.]|nr:alpha-2-macroglobulin [Rhizomicrobium sp.]
MDFQQLFSTLQVRLAEAGTRFAGLARKLPSRSRQLAHAIPPALGRIFGRPSFSWTPPGWMPALAATIRRHPKEFAGGALGAVTAIALGYGGWQWYLSLPRPPEPERITMEVAAPAISDYRQTDTGPRTIIHPLEVRFSGSAAPIERVGKVATSGITMEPALKGEWSWVDDRTLRFAPSMDWPVGAHVEVEFNTAQAFAPHVLMADDSFEFDMPAFVATAGSGEFYQDPQNPAAKKTIMPLVFNYPVDPAELEKRISLALKGRDGRGSQALKFTVTYDPLKLKAFVHSQPLELPRDTDAVVLKLAEGVRSSRGGEPTETEVRMEVVVPGLYSLAVSNLRTALVNDDQFEPEQIVMLTTSDAVRGETLAGAIRAWILPKRKPGYRQSDSAAPYGWDLSEISEEVLRASQPLKLELVPTEREYSAEQSFKYKAEPGQRIYIRIPAGLKSFGGYVLAKPDANTFAVPAYPTMLRFMADGALLSLNGEKRVSVVARNLPGMRLRIGRVLPDQIQNLVNFNGGNYARPELFDPVREDHLVERFEEVRAFPALKPGQAHYEGVDLSDHLQAGKRGVFLLRLSSYDPKRPNDSGSDNSDSRLVVVTDLGLLAKKSLDGSLDVFVQSIQSGQPVGGATVSVIAVNGQTLFTETSSADGVVRFPSLTGLGREKEPVMYVVTRDRDFSFLPIDRDDRKLNYSRFDVGGADNATADGELSAYLFSDRGIYRPGDRFHIGTIVRTANWARSPAGASLIAEIVDPRGITVKRMPLSVDASGFTELDYAPSETAPTGTWAVNLYIVGRNRDETAIGSTTVSVKEFLPDSMKAVASLSAYVADGWVKPDQLKGLVDVQNLFGTPAANRRIEASLTLNPTFPAFRDWPEYRFYDLRHAKEGYTAALQDGRSNEAGHAEFDLDLKKYADATYRLAFLAKAYEPEGGRNVASSAETLVSSNAWLVGYKSVDDLAYVPRNARRTVRLVAIDPQTRSIALGGLEAQLIERRYVSVLTKQDSGAYKYESRLKEVPISARPIAIPAGGTDYALPTDKPGDYALLIRQGGIDVNRVEYSVTGGANISRSLERNAELQVKLNKPDFSAGEQIEISLRAPYTGSGLITIERDKVYAHAWFKASTTNSVQRITVPRGFEGNGYINVQFIRDPSSDEIFMSPLSYGVVPFTVNLDAHRSGLTVAAPKLVKPGETVSFRLRSARPAKAVLFAVDEGILQVARYKLGDPLDFFFRKRVLDVETSQILDLILPEFKKLVTASAPGGDGDDAIGRQLNPFKRRQDKPVTYWSGIVEVRGERELRYTVPDYFNGRLRVMAVSVTPNEVGTFEDAVTVRGDFVLSPNIPTTLAPGDEADVSVGVANNLTAGGTVPVEVALKTGPQLQVVGNATQRIPLASMREGVVSFRVRATNALGSGNLGFTARAGGRTAQRNVAVSVRPASVYRTQIDVARLAPNGTRNINNLRRMYEANARRSASISTVPLVLTEGLTSWLVNYQNYCSEQIISATMPRLVAAKWSSVPAFGRALQPASGAVDNNVALAAQIDALRARQNARGGFGLWSATPDPEPFVSAYAVHLLLEARERGVAIPQDMLDSGNSYLRQLAADESASTLAELRQRAYAVYLLTRQGNVTTNNLAAVQKRLQDAFPNNWKTDLSAAWLAASYQLLKKDKDAESLIAGPQTLLERATDRGTFDYGYYIDPLTRDASTLYLLARHFPARAKALSPRVMENIARPLERDQFNTLSAAMTMLALDAYAGTAAGNLERLGITELRAGAPGRPISAIQGKLMQAASFSGTAAGLRFTDASPQPAWLVVNQAGYDSDVPSQPIRNGLEIIREYTDKNGRPLGRIALGDEIDVHVKIRATGDKGIGNLAIVDLLPGGFDPVFSVPQAGAQTSVSEGEAADMPVSPTLRLSNSTWSPVYTDVREDRVVIYGNASSGVQEFIYRIKASNAGRFIVPPAYGESMYDRRIQARSAGGAALTVVRP